MNYLYYFEKASIGINNSMRVKLLIFKNLNIIYFFYFKTFFFKCLFIFERQRETGNEQGRGRGRRNHRIQSRLQALRVSTEPDAGLEPTNQEIMTRAEVRR